MIQGKPILFIYLFIIRILSKTSLKFCSFFPFTCICVNKIECTLIALHTYDSSVLLVIFSNTKEDKESKVLLSIWSSIHPSHVVCVANAITMSNNPHHMPQYQHIETLVRDLHTAKTSAQPNNFHPANANQSNTPVSIAANPYPSVLTNNHHAHHRMMVHQLSPVHPPPTLSMIIDEEEFVSTDIVEVTNVMNAKANINHPSDVSMRLPVHKNLKTVGDDDINSSIPTTPITPLPSVMVNDIIEPLDLISTTQRRFSQLYSGLRRLSTSSTVGFDTQRRNTSKWWCWCCAVEKYKQTPCCLCITNMDLCFVCTLLTEPIWSIDNKWPNFHV